MSSRGFSLTEILIAIILMGLVVLAVASVDITSRRFFGISRDAAWIQDEAKIAMQHIISRVQRGVGNLTRPTTAIGSPPSANDSRGALILNNSGNLIDPTNSSDLGMQIQVKLDENENGVDPIIEYSYNSATDSINYTHPVEGTEVLAEGIVSRAIFEFDSINTMNRVEVTIAGRKDPDEDPSLDNPETVLTSSIILRAMSTR